MPDATPRHVNTAEPKRAERLVVVLTVIALGGVMLWRVNHLPSDQPHTVRDPGFLVDVNQSDADTLQLLPGLGPSIAANVVTRRETDGPFRSKAQLEEVRMIGPVLRERIEPWVTLEPPELFDRSAEKISPIPTTRSTPGGAGEAPR